MQASPNATLMICASRVDAFYVDADGLTVPQQQVDAALEKLFQLVANAHPLASAKTFKASNLFSNISVFASKEFDTTKQIFVQKLVAVIQNQFQPMKYKMHLMLNTLCEKLIQLYDVSYSDEMNIINELESKLPSVIEGSKSYVKVFKESLEKIVLQVKLDKKKEIIDELSDKKYAELAGQGEWTFRDQMLADMKLRFIKYIVPLVHDQQKRFILELNTKELSTLTKPVASMLSLWAEQYNVEFSSTLRLSIHWFGTVPCFSNKFLIGKIVFTLSHHILSKIVIKSQKELTTSTYDYLTFNDAVHDIYAQLKQHIFERCSMYEQNLALQKNILAAKIENHELLHSNSAVLHNVKDIWFELEKQRIYIENVHVSLSTEVIGKGSLGNVVKGTLNNQVVVAVKVISQQHKMHVLQYFAQEIYMMKYVVQ